MLQEHPTMEQMLDEIAEYLLPGRLCQRDNNQWILFPFRSSQLYGLKGFLSLEGPVFYPEFPVNFGKTLPAPTKEFQKLKTVWVGQDNWRPLFRKYLDQGYVQLETIPLPETLAKAYLSVQSLWPWRSCLEDLFRLLRSARIHAFPEITQHSVPWL
jgi:hypothetical protein